MSRPNSSVPRKCSPPGGRSRLPGTRRVGLWVEITSARKAARTKRRRMAAPPTTPGCRSSRPSQVGSARSVIEDPRGDEGVKEIDEQVDDHVGCRRHQDNALYHGIVAPEDGGDDEPPESGNV